MRLSVLFAAAALVAGGSADAASFDCARARAPDERAICADRRLNDQDVRMATWLTVLGQVQLMGGNGAMHDDQRAWLRQRRSCRADRVCLAHAYDRRLGVLTTGFGNWAATVR